MKLKETLQMSNRAIRLLYQYYPKLIISSFGYEIWNALTPYAGIYLGAAIVEELSGGKDIQRLKMLVLAALLVGIVTAGITSLLKRWKEIQSAGIERKIFYIYSQKMMEMDFSAVDQPKTSELFHRIWENHDGGRWGLEYVLIIYQVLCRDFFLLTGGIGMSIALFTSRVPKEMEDPFFLNHPVWIGVLLGTLVLSAYASMKLYEKVVSFWSQNSDAHALGNRLWEFYSSLGQKRALAEDVRIYRQDLKCDPYFSNKETTFGSRGLFASYAKGPMGIYAGASGAVLYLFTGVSYLYVCLKAWEGAFGIGLASKYLSSITMSAQALSKLFSNFGGLRANEKFLQMVFEFLDIPNEMYQGSLTVEKRSDRKYEVEFRDVSFKYPGSENYALKNINMKFEIGKRLAVVGRNGSGKTTFIKLLCRLYDPTEGEVLLNGIDIRKYDYAEYLSIFSVVFQDFCLFSLKLGENIATSSAFQKEKVSDCLENAGFGDRLAKMEQGIDTYLYKDYEENGIDISGGEAQKIAIARALYKDAPFMILDEPTAALDPMAEAEIYSRFNEIVGDKTAVYISHRLSSCKFCDEILVFDKGSVIQQGSHENLVKVPGKYQELWNAQAQYYVK